MQNDKILAYIEIIPKTIANITTHVKMLLHLDQQCSLHRIFGHLYPRNIQGPHYLHLTSTLLYPNPSPSCNLSPTHTQAPAMTLAPTLTLAITFTGTSENYISVLHPLAVNDISGASPAKGLNYIFLNSLSGITYSLLILIMSRATSDGLVSAS